jgi:hypothetical protein
MSAMSPQRRTFGRCTPFVDPCLTAPEAPVCWLTQTGIAALTATAARASNVDDADLNLAELPSVRHIIVEHHATQRLLVRVTNAAMTLELKGDFIIKAPVNLTFHIERLAHATLAGSYLVQLPRLLSLPPRHAVRSVRRTLLRSAIIALDGRRVGASYRDMANVAFGGVRTTAAWNSTSRALKDHMVRALDKGIDLVEGGYRQLLR